MVLGGKVEPRQVEERGPGNRFFSGERREVIVDDPRVLSRNPVIRATEVLFLDICQ